MDRSLAGALSAGAVAKDPPSTEPNEDGFLLRRDGDRIALLVLDGAGGFSAADAVLDAMDGVLPVLMRAPSLPNAAACAWAAALRARNRVQAVSGTRRRPHVAISLVLVEHDRAAWCATTGDTAVLAVGSGGVKLLSGVAPHLDHHAPLPQPQRIQLAGDDVLVGVTDGFFDALGRAWPDALHRSISPPGRRSAMGDAERLVDAALRAGGPDHVTAVVHHPR